MVKLIVIGKGLRQLQKVAALVTKVLTKCCWPFYLNILTWSCVGGSSWSKRSVWV